MAWWWIPVMLIVGILIGMICAGVMFAAKMEDERQKRWWE